MKRTKPIIIALAATVLILTPPRAYAPLFGGFPGLDSLMRDSDAVVILRVEKGTSELDFGGGASYLVTPLESIKGGLETGRTIRVRMRLLPYVGGTPDDPGATNMVSFFQRGIAEGRNYLTFLSSEYLTATACGEFHNVNCSGSVIPMYAPVSSNAHLDPTNRLRAVISQVVTSCPPDEASFLKSWFLKMEE